MKVKRVEQHRIKKNDVLFSIIDDLCWKSKNLYNYGNYIIRQEFISTTQEKEKGLRENAHWITYNELFRLCKCSDAYKELGSNVGQATLRKLDKNWKSFFITIKDYSIHSSKYLGRPKLPRYLPKENGRYECCLDNNKFKIIDGYLFFCWKPLKIMNNRFMTRILTGSKLYQIRFVPDGLDYIIEVVYEIDVPDIEEKQSTRIASIDLGIDNLMTITTNCGINPFVINGKPLKSMNQYYNKKLSEMQSELKRRHGKDWSLSMQNFITKRNNKVDNYIQNATKIVIDWCVKNDIDTLVCGYNPGWKQESDIGKHNNQKFTAIPYLSVINRLNYKCENVGIRFITIEESYTSGTSFLDNELPIKDNYDKSRRVYRGLFISNDGYIINSDVNGSYQIMHKVFQDVTKESINELGLHPVIINIG